MANLEPEAGIFYAVCWIVVIIRLTSRRMQRGTWKRLQLDDYLILAAMATDTVLNAVMHQVVKYDSNLIPPDDDPSKYSQADIQNRILGSKLVLVVEQMQILTIWIVKSCLLIMYNRMTLVLPQHKIVIGTSIYVATAFVVMEILYFAVWCRPFSQYWAVPAYSTQCSAATHHLITNTVFNVSSDLIIISIPIPVLFRVRLQTRKNKIILCGLFMIGAFTIVAAVLNKYYSFTNPFGTEWTIWYLRESYTAILCANLPLTYPLIQRVFGLKNWSAPAYTANSQYRDDSMQGPSSRTMWSGSKPMPAHRSLNTGVRRTEIEEVTDLEIGLQRDQDPQFITSAIDEEDMRDPAGSSSGTLGGESARRDVGKLVDHDAV